uniref:Uncharacterized protein n=1 Tax=Mycena chlorophos TaxID=658473 RepID=A0ABQ0LBK8_MYCCL|nr:predicted protein [Mycena chlorophos]
MANASAGLCTATTSAWKQQNMTKRADSPMHDRPDAVTGDLKKGDWDSRLVGRGSGLDAVDGGGGGRSLSSLLLLGWKGRQRPHRSGSSSRTAALRVGNQDGRVRDEAGRITTGHKLMSTQAEETRKTHLCTTDIFANHPHQSASRPSPSCSPLFHLPNRLLRAQHTQYPTPALRQARRRREFCGWMRCSRDLSAGLQFAVDVEGEEERKERGAESRWATRVGPVTLTHFAPRQQPRVVDCNAPAGYKRPAGGLGSSCGRNPSHSPSRQPPTTLTRQRASTRPDPKHHDNRLSAVFAFTVCQLVRLTPNTISHSLMLGRCLQSTLPTTSSRPSSPSPLGLNVAAMSFRRAVTIPAYPPSTRRKTQGSICFISAGSLAGCLSARSGRADCPGVAATRLTLLAVVQPDTACLVNCRCGKTSNQHSHSGIVLSPGSLPPRNANAPQEDSFKLSLPTTKVAVLFLRQKLTRPCRFLYFNLRPDLLTVAA